MGTRHNNQQRRKKNMKASDIPPQMAQREAAPPLPETAVPRLQPTTEDIAVLAYQFYESDGRPDGCAEVHWLAAERFLQQRCGDSYWLG
jgi:hypothetical protein